MRGAPANDLGLALVPEEVKTDRWNRFMARQQAISARLLQRKVGKRLSVLIDEAGGGAMGKPAKGRSKADAPQIDGAVYVTARRPLRAGDIVSVKIEHADAYDLHGAAV